MPALAIVALTLAMLACAIAVPAAEGAVNARYRDRVGMGTHLRYDRPAEVQAALQQLRDGGVTWVREDFRWDQVEPIRGAADWRLTDNLMTGAAKAGVDVLALVDYSAPWASSDPSGGGDLFHAPADFADYAAFARRVVERYGRGGTFWSLHPELTPRPLRAVEVWNEPYGRWFWKPDPNPAAYARLVRATAGAVRQADPEIDVLASGDLLQARTDGRIVGWIESLLDADPGLGDVIDAWTVHPYPGPRDLGPYEAPKPRHAFSRVTLSRDIAAARGVHKPFWITEIGWSTGPGDPEGISEERQAEFTRDAVERAITEWGVERVFVYSWGKSKNPREQRDYALRRSDGTARPAWSALRSLIGNRAPTVAVAGGSTRVGRPLTLRATAGDPDGDAVSVRWDLDGDGAHDDAGGTEAVVVPSAAGALRVGAEADDGSGAVTRAGAVVEVTGGEPPAAEAAPAPGTGAPGTAAPPAGTAGPPPAPAAPTQAAPLTFGLAVVTQPSATVARRGMALRVTCPAGCDATFEVLVAGKPLVGGVKRRSLPARAVTVRVPLRPWLRKRLRKRAKVGLLVRASLQGSGSGARRKVELRTRLAPRP